MPKPETPAGPSKEEWEAEAGLQKTRAERAEAKERDMETDVQDMKTKMKAFHIYHQERDTRIQELEGLLEDADKTVACQTPVVLAAKSWILQEYGPNFPLTYVRYKDMNLARAVSEFIKEAGA